MTVQQEVVVELREIRAELKHLNERFDEALAHRDQMQQMHHAGYERRHKTQEERLAILERIVKGNERKLIAYTAVIAAAVLVAGLAVRLI